MRRKRTRRGFTIIELVIVIAVIAILCAVLIPSFAGVIERAISASGGVESRNSELSDRLDSTEKDSSFTSGNNQNPNGDHTTTSLQETESGSGEETEPPLYYTMSLTGYSLTLQGDAEKITYDFTQLRSLCDFGNITVSNPNEAPVVQHDIERTVSGTTEWNWACKFLPGILKEIFGVDPSTNTYGPQIAVECVSLKKMLDVSNQDPDDMYFSLVFGDMQGESAETNFTDIGNYLTIYVFGDGRIAIYDSLRADPNSAAFIVVSNSSEKQITYNGKTYGNGYQVDRTALEKHLTWMTDNQSCVGDTE